MSAPAEPPAPEPCRRKGLPRAIVGAAAGLGAVWAAVIGLKIAQGDTDDLAALIAVAVATMSAAVIPFLRRRR